ncbi:hypothetical protein KA005_23115 [bacterium]|nr:hypothetical protein [bacterium]
MQIDIPSNSIIRQFLFAFTNLGYKYIFKYSAKNILFLDHYYILYLNLSSLKTPTKSRFNYALRLAQKSEFEDLIENLPEFELDARKEIISRVFFYQAGFKHCYLANSETGKLAYMQWLIYPDENEIIAKNFRYRFYPLKPNQVMLENAFTFPKFRGLGLLPNISAELLTIARNQGYKNAIVYIKKNQIASMNEFMKLNFKIRKIVREYKVFGITKRTL